MYYDLFNKTDFKEITALIIKKFIKLTNSLQNLSESIRRPFILEFLVQKIFSLFNSNDSRPFIRVIIFSDCIELFHIHNEIIKIIKISQEKSDQIFNYLSIYKNTSIELVISNKFMSCKSVAQKSVSKREIKTLADNILESKQGSVNAVFFDNINQYKNKFYTICSANLEKSTIDFINQLLAINNNVNIVAWPAWIVFTYFQNFPTDKEKFNCSLFTIERSDSFEIIVYTDNGIICYRNGDLKLEEKEVEIENTIKYVRKTYNISPKEMAIYSIDEQILETLLKKIPNNMEIVCNEIDNSLLKYKHNVNKIIKIAFNLFLLLLLSKCCLGLFYIHDIEKQINKYNNDIDLFDKNIFSELDLWDNINCSLIDDLDFKALLKRRIETEKIGKIQNATISIDKESQEIAIRLIPEKS